MNEDKLVAAIVRQAAMDWQNAARAEKRAREHGYDVVSFARVEVETFFRSRWFDDLTSLDGDEIIRQLEGMI
jgi:hypothetical protein